MRSNLVQQELTRLGINSIALLNKTVRVAPDVMQKLRHLLDRKIERQDHELMETMEKLTIKRKEEKIPLAIRSRVVEKDCQSIVNTLVDSITKVVLLRTSYLERQHLTSTQPTQGVGIELKSSKPERVQCVDAKTEYESCSNCSSGDETLVGESTQESVRHSTGNRAPSGLNKLSRESIPGQLRDRILSGESRNMKNKSEVDCVDTISSSDEAKSQTWRNGSETT